MSWAHCNNAHRSFYPPTLRFLKRPYTCLKKKRWAKRGLNKALLPTKVKIWYSDFDTLYHTMEAHSEKVRIPVRIHYSPTGPCLQVKGKQVDTNLNPLVRHMQLLCIPQGYLCVKCQGITKQGHLKYWQKSRVQKCAIICLNPLKECSARGRGDIFFQRATKDVLERRLACSQSLRCCVPAAGSALKGDPVDIKEVKFHKLVEKDAVKNPDLVWMQCSVNMSFKSSSVQQKLWKNKKPKENRYIKFFDVFQSKTDVLSAWTEPDSCLSPPVRVQQTETCWNVMVDWFSTVRKVKLGWNLVSGVKHGDEHGRNLKVVKFLSEVILWLML